MSKYKDFSQSLMHSNSYEDSFNSFDTYIQALGCQSSAYIFVPKTPFDDHQEHMPTFSFSDHFSQSFLEEYEGRNFQNSDYIFDAIKRGKDNRLYLWGNDLKNRKLKQSQRRVIEVATYDHKMGNSISILTRKGRNGTGAVTLVGDSSDRFFSQYLKEHSEDFRMATEAFHNHIITRSYEANAFIIPSLFSELNITERQVLKCLLEGLAVHMIAKKVYKSKKYLERVIRNIRIKVGGKLPNGKPRISKDALICFCSQMQIYTAL